MWSVFLSFSRSSQYLLVDDSMYVRMCVHLPTTFSVLLHKAWPIGSKKTIIKSALPPTYVRTGDYKFITAQYNLKTLLSGHLNTYTHVILMHAIVFITYLRTCIYTFVTGPAKINHVSTNYTKLYFRQYLQLWIWYPISVNFRIKPIKFCSSDRDFIAFV